MLLLNFSHPLTVPNLAQLAARISAFQDNPADTITYQLTINIAASVLSALGGVLIAFAIRRWYWDRCFNGWVVKVTQNGVEKVNRTISPRKAKEIYEEPADLSVFLKGIASPYSYIRGDILEEGPKLGLLNPIEHENRKIGFRTWCLPWRIRRTYMIDLDKNPREVQRPICMLAGFPGKLTGNDRNAEATICPIADFLSQQIKSDSATATPKPASF